jgi:hypothetical protein
MVPPDHAAERWPLPQWVMVALRILVGAAGVVALLERSPTVAIAAVVAIVIVGLLIRYPGWTSRGAAGAWRALGQRRGLASLAIGMVFGLVVPSVWQAIEHSRQPPCSPSCFDFEGGSAEGWFIRWEGPDRLGDRLEVTDAADRGPWWEHNALSFDFRLAARPYDKAQVATENLKLERELSAWVYLPRGTPDTLELFGYVLERNDDGHDPGKPEWPFFKTPTVHLRPGTWTRVSFVADQFAGVNTNLRWSNPPHLLGFEVHGVDRGVLHGTVYFDDISVT